MAKNYGLILKSNCITKPTMPLIAYSDMKSFKAFMLDVGLLAAKGELPARTLLEKSRVFTEFKGALTEQFIAQELTSCKKDLYYYSTPNSSGEIDFAIQQQDHLIPIEVKAEENLKAQSLRAFCQKYQPNIALRSSMSNYREQEWMKNIPLYYLAYYITRQID